MKRSEFLKSLGGILGLSIIAPKIVSEIQSEELEETKPNNDANRFKILENIESLSGGTSTSIMYFENVEL